MFCSLKRIEIKNAIGFFVIVLERWYLFGDGSDRNECGLTPQTACATLDQVARRQPKSCPVDEPARDHIEIVTDISFSITQKDLVI